MFQFGSESTSKTYGAIIDVGSGSVGVSIIESNTAEEVPHILYVHRELMRVNTESVPREEKIRQMREAVFSASLALSTEGLQTLAEHNKKARIERILVTCASPWAYTLSRNVSYVNDKEVKVTSELIHDLEGNAEEQIEEEVRQSELVGKLGLHTVERTTVSARINGYLVNDPRGLSGKEIELSHVVGFVPEEIIDTINEVREKTLTDTDLSVHTFLLVNFCIIRDLLDDIDTLAVINVTGESTEIGIIENGILLQSHHVPYGSHTLLRDITKQSGAGAEHALTLLHGFAEGTLNEEDLKKVEEYTQQFSHVFKEVLDHIHEKQNIPATLTITTLPQFESFFKKVIPKTMYHTTHAPCNLLDTTNEALRDMKLPDNESDIFIALASRFFHKLHGCSEIDKL